MSGSVTNEEARTIEQLQALMAGPEPASPFKASLRILTAEQVQANKRACNRCDHRLATRCVDGRPAMEHARAGACPKGLFSYRVESTTRRVRKTFGGGGTTTMELRGHAPLASRSTEPVRMFSVVRVISLMRTPERLAAFWEAFPGDWPFVRPELLVASDGTRETAPKGWRGGGPAWGCARSWMRILEEAITMGLADDPEAGAILGLEDDCRFVEGAAERIAIAMRAVPDDWEILFLGGQHQRPPQRVSDELVLCRETGRTHAMAVRPTFLRSLLAFWREWDTHVDHGLQKWAREDETRRYYGVSPWVAYQGANRSTIRYRDEPARAWDSRVKFGK